MRAGPKAGTTTIQSSRSPLEIEFSAAGSILGNLLGKSLAGDNKLARAASSAFFKTVGQTLGDLLDASFDGVPGTDVSGVLISFDEKLFPNLKGKAVGVISSFLVSQLIGKLGIDGFILEPNSEVTAR